MQNIKLSIKQGDIFEPLFFKYKTAFKMDKLFIFMLHH